MAVKNGGMNSLVGIETARSKFIVVTNPMNYQPTYPQEVASFIHDTPGPTPAICHTKDQNALTFPLAQKSRYRNPQS